MDSIVSRSTACVTEIKLSLLDSAVLMVAVLPSNAVPEVIPKFLLNAVFLENVGSPPKLTKDDTAFVTSDKLLAASKSPVPPPLELMDDIVKLSAIDVIIMLGPAISVLNCSSFPIFCLYTPAPGPTFKTLSVSEDMLSDSLISFTDLPFIEKLLKFNKPTILSSGMSSQKEIKMVYDFILKY